MLWHNETQLRPGGGFWVAIIVKMMGTLEFTVRKIAKFVSRMISAANYEVNIVRWWWEVTVPGM